MESPLLLEQVPRELEAEDAMQPAYAARPMPGFKTHTATLLHKNWQLKKRQWWTACCCFKGWCPCAGFCEVVFPLLIMIPLVFAKYECGDTCLLFTVGGWGGQIPEVFVQRGVTACEDQTHPGWNEDSKMTCNSWTGTTVQASSFFDIMSCISSVDLTLAIVVENPADKVKRQKMVDYISEQWYPGLDIPANLTEPDGTPLCFDNMCQNKLRSLVGYEFANRCQSYAGDDTAARCCSQPQKSFKQLVNGNLETASDLDSFLKNWDNTYADEGGQGLIWGAVIFTKMGSGEGGPGGDGDWEYTIRLNSSSSVPGTSGPATTILRPSAHSYQVQSYDESGFVPLQLLIDRYIINQKSDVADVKVVQKNVESFGSSGTTYPTSRAATMWLSDWSRSYHNGWINWVSEHADEMVASIAKPHKYAPETVSTAALPVQDQKIDGFYQLGLPVFGLFFILAFLYSMYGVVAWLIVEKETKIRESLKMMGVHTAALLCSFYGLQAIVFGVLSFIFSIFLTCFSPGDSAVLPASSTILVFVFFFLWCMAFVSFAFAFHTLFNKAMTGGIVAALVMLAQYVIYKVITITPGATSGVALGFLCLLPNCALTLGIELIGNFESLHIGATFGNLFYSDNNASLAMVLGMLMLDIVLWTMLGWYLENVFPKEFGVQQPPHFFLQKSYWKEEPRPRGSLIEPDGLFARLSRGLLGDTTDTLPGRAENDGSVEPVADSLQASIEIRGLRKTFSTPAGQKVAVSSLNMSMYEGQILALLGHNGAGKTTTIHMLTGMLAPSSGDATILGRSIRTEMDAIRKTVGVCPQHDILWADLTVEDHLVIFAKLKGLDPMTCVGAKIAEVGLTEKASTKSGELSGGMKRKLSLCMSLIGDPKVIFLDEPTSGMDPFSRRSTWNMLQANRHGRAMVLTTHFMDEADLLGDRIAILAEGELQCCGSSLFLKNRFGAGYRLVCSRGATDTGGPRCDATAVESLLQRHVAAAKLLTDVGAEMTFQLPTEAVRSFPAMLRSLDSSKAGLGMQEYGLAQVTMEEVFLRVGQSATHGATEDKSALQNGSAEAALGRNMGDGTATPMSLAVMPPHEIFLRHLGALFMKRVEFGKRDYCSIFCSVLLPALMLCGCLSLIQDQQTTVPNLVALDASQFEQYGPQSPLPWATAGPAAGFDKSIWSDVDGLVPKQEIPLAAAPTSFFGRNYTQKNDNQKAGLPTRANIADFNVPECSMLSDPSTCYNDPSQFGVPQEPDKVLSMMNTMWLDGQGAAPKDVAWGGVLFPAASDTAAQPVTILYNTSAVHSFPTFTSVATNALRRKAGGSGHIKVSNQPLPMVGEAAATSNQAWNLLTTIMIIVTFAFVPAAVIAFPVMEAEAHHNSRHQQYISGVSIPAYWLSNFCWDLALFLVLLLFSAIALQVYDVQGFVKSDCADAASTGGTVSGPSMCQILTLPNPPYTCSTDLHTVGDGTAPQGSYVSLLCPVTCDACGAGPFGVVIVLFLSYGMAVIPATYLVSFLFKNHTTAQMFALLANIILGLMLVLTSYILKIINEDTQKWNNRLTPLFRMSPGFNLGNGIFNIANRLLNEGLFQMANPNSPPLGPRLYQWDIVGADIFFLFLSCALYLPLVMGVDYLRNFPWVQKVIPFIGDAQIEEVVDYEVDPDVAAEERRVLGLPEPTGMAGDVNQDVIHIRNLRKVYGSGSKVKVAVRALTLGLPKGDCFGFLGINGAGKTSSLNILTGAQLPTSGDAWLGGKNILTNQKDVRRLIGYCPQHDALLSRLTVREHLRLFGRIKGVKADLETFVQEMMTNLDLKSHEHKLASTLSGGNKRKLGVGIALMGSPQLVFLDEPSTGVDPGARRFMWDIISRLSTHRKECTVVLTTHNMEEAEALCSSIGIMVGGRLRCIGSNQRLKAKFGQGYQLELKLGEPTEQEKAQMCTERQLPAVISSLQEIANLCGMLGDPQRAALVVDGCEEGYLVYSALRQAGQVTAEQFAAWWLSETSARALDSTLQQSFGDKVQLLERHERSFRFRITTGGGDSELSLADVFEQLEDHVRASVAIEEYGLSQASLEQVFNQFAAQQEEETGGVRGMEANNLPVMVQGHAQLAVQQVPMAQQIQAFNAV